MCCVTTRRLSIYNFVNNQNENLPKKLKGAKNSNKFLTKFSDQFKNINKKFIETLNEPIKLKKFPIRICLVPENEPSICMGATQRKLVNNKFKKNLSLKSRSFWVHKIYNRRHFLFDFPIMKPIILFTCTYKVKKKL
jgi:hypothetical protein